MKSFFKLVFATVFGFFIAFFLLFIFFMGMGLSGSDEGVKKVDANSILHLTLSGSLPDVAIDNPFGSIDPFSGSLISEKEMGLFELKKILTHAEKDDKIKGILLNTDNLQAGMANGMDLRAALEKFKKSGKFIYAYSNYSSEQSVLLNSVADKYYLNPFGGAEFNGFGLELMYFTGLLEKLNIKPMIFYAGEFKSATEPFRLKAMSPENRLQYTQLLDVMYSNYLSKLSFSRKISVDSLKTMAANLSIIKAEDALKAKLVDGLKYEDEVLDELRKKLGYKKDDALKLVNVNDYAHSFDPKKDDGKSKNKIAVIYAEGNIVDGDGEGGDIASTPYLKMLRKIRNDKDIKAIVLRVNSPGGSAFASEVILRELKLIHKNIPVVVSMGDYAASGGYYISTAADKIFAEPTTLTGSIGVFGMLFNISGALENKLGITTDRVKTAPYADFGTGTREWDEKEKAAITSSIQFTYSTFLKHVADNRKMSIAQVDSVARGRVWTGKDALGIGLVDALGNLEDAINEAKRLAKIEEFVPVSYPEQKSFMDQIMEKISGKSEDETAKALQNYLGEDYQYIQMIRNLRNLQGVQARLPYEIRVK